jgi:serine/threonine-protein kinase RsbW
MGAAKSNPRHGPEPSRKRAARRPGRNSTPLAFTFGSNYEQGRDVQARIVDYIETHAKLGEQDLFAVKLALEEALINAIKHGNKLDPAKKVHVQAKVDSDRVEISIEDEGPGFDRKSVPDPTADENLCKCSGRGILLIEAYMTSVKWSKKGRRVTMVKVNES